MFGARRGVLRGVGGALGKGGHFFNPFRVGADVGAPAAIRHGADAHALRGRVQRPTRLRVRALRRARQVRDARVPDVLKTHAFLAQRQKVVVVVVDAR
jgi:hypothetical protein